MSQITRISDCSETFGVDKDNYLTSTKGSKLPELWLGASGSETQVSATASEINSVAKTSSRLVNHTAATLTLSEALHGNKIVTVNKADGTAITLPAATGGGSQFELFIGTTITSVGSTIKVANSSDTMVGFVTQFADGGTTVVSYEISGTDDTITLDGSTKGGIKGDKILLTDIAVNLWSVEVKVSATGTEASPMSATV